MTSFERFGDQFQTKILYHIVTDKHFALQVMEILDPNFFSNESYVEIATIIKDWNEKYNSVPTFDNLDTVIKTEYEGVERDYLLDLCSAIREGINVTDKDFIVDKTIDFCKQQAMRNAILASVDLLKKDKYDEIYGLIKEALVAGQSKDIGHSYVKSALVRTSAERNPIGTGFPMLDNEYIAGGLSAGEIGIIMGGTGAGKSFMLAQLAYAAFMQGKTVVIYSFELQEVPFALRLDSKFTGIPLTTLLLDNEGEHRKTCEEAILRAQATTGAEPEIIIKEYPTRTATLPMMKNHMLQMQAQGKKPDLIIVDYADLVKPTRFRKEVRHELQEMIEDLRGWGAEAGCPIWTASQTNRDGWDTAIVRLGAISEAAAKAFAADLVIAIGRDENLIASESACYFLAKSRLGPDKLAFTGRFNTSIMDFTIEELGYDQERFQAERVSNNMQEAVRNVLSGQSNPRGADENLRHILDLIGDD